jgi:hypothetical protein
MPVGTSKQHFYVLQHYTQGTPDASGGLTGEVDLGEGR